MSKVYLKYLLMMLFVVPLLCLGVSANAQDDCYVSLSSNATTLNCNYQEVIIIASGSDDSMTYEWSNGQISDRIMASASGNYYVTATTTNGCTASASIAITEDYSVPQVTITSISGTTTLTCSETEITIMAEGGSSYFWSDGSSSSEITVTNPGLYMVTANGENGCTVTASIDIIGSTESPSVYVSGENSLCSGQIAMLTASAMGGMSPYNYIWSDGSNGETANLSAGSYGVTVTDSNGCTASRQITLEESSPIMLSINGSSTICAGEDVELTAMAIGGTPDYRYAWSSGENNPSIIVAPTLTTTYIVTATDANGCYAEQDITITVSVPLTISLNSESFILTCSNPSANIEATVSEGTAPYLYTWSNGETSSSIMANAAGMYLVTATDANGCSAMASATVTSQNDTEAPTIICPSSMTVSTDEGSNTANVILSDVIVDDNTAVDYYINNYNNTQDASGIYELGVTDVVYTVVDICGNSNSCSFTVTVIDNEPPCIGCDQNNVDNPFDPTAGVSCSTITGTEVSPNEGVSTYTHNGSDWDITANDNVGIASIVYSLSGATMNVTQPNTTLDGQVFELGSTTVTWTVTDLSGNFSNCSFTVTVSDNEPPCIGCAPSNIDNPFDPTAGVSCSTITGTEVSPNEGVSTYTHNGSDWDITANDNVGIASIVYSLSGATMNITQPNTTLNGQVFELGSTTITWTVTDLSGNFSECSFTVTVSDNEPPAINGNNFDRELTSSSCSFVVPDLTEEIRAVSSDNTTANSDLVITQDLSAGYQITTTTMVTITVRDQSGNETSTTVVLSIPNTPTIMVNSRDVVCQGEMAEATVAVTGGTAPYAYNWSDGTTGATANLMVGSYVVTVTDSNGCSAEYSLSVLESEMPVLLLNADATVLTCSTQMSNITATVSGGTAPYVYTWSNGLTTDSIMVSNAGLYSVTLTDANGCEAMQSIVITEDVNAPMLSIVNNSNTTTLGCVNTEINLVATGGAAYIWSNGVSTAENVITTVGTYSVTATGTNGCTAYETISITEVPGLTIAVNSNDIVCNGGTTEATVFVNGGTEPYVYNWNNGMTTSTANLGAGYYIVTVTDSNGCTAEYSFAVTEPEVFVASITSTSIQCYGESTGSATVTVTGGTAPYTYNWGTISTQESTVTGLAAGTYSVEITDANGCNVTQSVTIDQPAMLDVYVTPSTTTICSGSSANIAATAMGGNPSYMYLWNDGSTTSVIEVTPFSTTTYSLTVTDANGCTAMQNVTVEVSAPLDVMVNSSDLACHGGTTEATVVVNGGAEPYIYSWSNGTMGATATIGAGYYIVTVTDSNGCSAEYSFTVAEPDLLVLSLSADSLSSSNPTANITAAVTGGNAPYSYQWNNGSTTSSIQVNEAGAYSVTVVDSHGCSATESVTVNSEIDNESPCIGCDPNGIDPFDPTAGISCSTILNTHLSTDNEASTYTHNGSDWDITANDNTGIASITYSLSGATNTITGLNTTLDGQIFEIGSTTVTWTVVDLYGNYSDCSFTVTVVDNEPPCIGCDPDPNTPENEGVSCTDIAVAGTIEVTPDLEASTYTHNGNDWDITATDNVQVASITYAVSGNDNTTLTAPNTTLNGQVFGLGTTTVTWTVLDDSGNPSTCSFMVNVTDNEPPAINGNNFDRELTSSSCSFVVPDLTEEIRAVSSDNTTANSDLVITQDLSAGSQITTTTMVTVTVSDQYGNVTSTTVVLTIPNTPTITVNSNNLVCNGGTTEASVVVTGGTEPYIYNWSDGATGATANLMVGSYVVTVTDSNGCTAEYSFSVTESDMLVLSLSADATELTCANSTANITAAVTGGTAPYIYTWSDNSTSNTIVANNAGVYNVNVTDANGCSAMQSITITEDVNVPMLSIVNNSNTTTLGCANTEINLIATGGDAYTWSNGVSTAENVITAAGTYYVTATGANGCTAYDAISITEVPALTIAVNSSNVVCHGETTEATVFVNGGTEPYVYNWNNGMTTSTANLGAGDYIVTVTDSYGCTAAYDFTVTEPDMLVLSLSADVIELTCNTPMSNITAAVVGGTAPYIYTWSDNSTSNSIVANNAGVYNVNVTDANGCSAMQSITITEDVNVPMLSIVNNSNTTILGCANTEINLIATGGDAYVWSNGVSTAENVITAAGTYSVTATGANGCTAYETISITEVPALTIAVNSSNIACHGETTEATVFVNGGTEPYVYNWNNGMTTPNVNLGAGEYIVTVSDASGCTATAQISVVEPEALVVNLTSGTITCAEPTVTITATTIGGTVPYSYMWSDGSVANAIEVYADGVYMVTVVDANGCSAVANVDVESTMGITANVSVVNAQNSDIANGAANVAVVGGVAPYRVVMSQETASYEYVFMENSFVISNLPAATYSLAITDANGCVANVNFVIENICNISVAEQVTDNGTILHFENVVYPVTVYVDGNTNGTATEDGYMLQNVENGVHNVFVADANGCFANISVFVEGINCDNVNLTANVSVTPTTSTTNPNGSAVVIAEGGQAPYSFSWSNGNIGDNATDLYQGIYTVVVTDANGCVGTTSFEITYNVPEEEFDELYVTLDYHLEMEQTYTDDGISVIPVAVVYAQAFGGSAPYDYSWMAAGADNGCYFKMYESGSVCVEVRDEQNNAVNGCIYVDVPVTEEISNEIVEEVSQAVDSCFDARFVKAQVLEYAIDTVSGDCVVTWELFDVNGNVHNIDVAYPLDSALSGIYAFNLYFTCNGGRLVTSFSVRLYIEVEGGDPVSVEEIVVSSANAYPNPFTDIINVEIESAVSEDAEISVVNLNGQVVYMTNKHLSAGQNSFEINADNYVPGVYFIRINGSEINETLKMVK